MWNGSDSMAGNCFSSYVKDVSSTCSGLLDLQSAFNFFGHRKDKNRTATEKKRVICFTEKFCPETRGSWFLKILILARYKLRGPNWSKFTFRKLIVLDIRSTLWKIFASCSSPFLSLAYERSHHLDSLSSACSSGQPRIASEIFNYKLGQSPWSFVLNITGVLLAIIRAVSS